jgi:hypothetical protein
MFASGVVKIQSRQVWGDLTAMDYHYATQPLPTPASWLAYQLPHQVQRLSTAATIVLQVPATLLLLAPTARVRAYGAWAHVLMMLVIAVTGNYCFFNMLAVVLVLPDIVVDAASSSPTSSGINGTDKGKKPVVYWFSWVVLADVFAFLGLCSVTMFRLDGLTLHLVETKDVLDERLVYVLPAMITATALMLLWTWVRLLVGGGLRSLRALVLAPVVGFVYVATLYPITQLAPSVREGFLYRVPGLQHAMVAQNTIVQLYGLSNVASSYEMADPTSISHVQRPEIVLQGSDDGKTWHTYEFAYKPTDVHVNPSFVAPHQPRLDWQMWFAALDSWQQPWFLRLVDGLHRHEPAVLALLGDNRALLEALPVGAQFVRAQLYHYDFTRMGLPGDAVRVILGSPGDAGRPAVWKRSLANADWMPPLRRGDVRLRSYFATLHMDEEGTRAYCQQNP